MNAIFVPEQDVYICPTCKGGLQYWVTYDILLCPECLGAGYDPDTGEEQGPIT